MKSRIQAKRAWTTGEAVQTVEKFLYQNRYMALVIITSLLTLCFLHYSNLQLLLICLISLSLLMAVIEDVMLGIYAAILIQPLSPFLPSYKILTITESILIVTIIAWGLNKLLKRETVRAPLMFPLLLVGAIGFTSLVKAVDFTDSFENWCLLSFLIMLCIMIGDTVSLKDIKRLIIVLSLSVVMSTLCGLYIFFIYSGNNQALISLSENGGRFAGLSHNSNEYAYQTLLIMSLLAYFFIKGRTWLMRTSILSTAGLFIYGIILSMSRGGYLSTLTSFLILLRYRIMRILLVCLIPFMVVIVPIQYENFMARRNPVSRRESSEARLSLWRSALAMIQDNPLLGVGMDMFQIRYIEYEESGYRGYWRENEGGTHNTYLLVLTEMGIIGFILYVWFLTAFGRALFIVHRKGNAEHSTLALCFLAGLCGILTGNMVCSLFYRTYVWICVGMGLGLIKEWRKNSTRETRLSDTGGRAAMKAIQNTLTRKRMMYTTCGAALAIVLVLNVNPGTGKEAADLPPLKELVNTALERNPEIQAQKERQKIAPYLIARDGSTTAMALAKKSRKHYETIRLKQVRNKVVYELIKEYTKYQNTVDEKKLTTTIREEYEDFLKVAESQYLNASGEIDIISLTELKKKHSEAVIEEKRVVYKLQLQKQKVRMIAGLYKLTGSARKKLSKNQRSTRKIKGKAASLQNLPSLAELQELGLQYNLDILLEEKRIALDMYQDIDGTRSGSSVAYVRKRFKNLGNLRLEGVKSMVQLNLNQEYGTYRFLLDRKDMFEELIPLYEDTYSIEEEAYTAQERPPNDYLGVKISLMKARAEREKLLRELELQKMLLFTIAGYAFGKDGTLVLEGK